MNVLSNIDLVLDYLESRSDVVDGDYGQPDPNEEMNLSRELQEARDAVAELVKAAKYATAQHNYPQSFRPEANHWCATLQNALANFGD